MYNVHFSFPLLGFAGFLTDQITPREVKIAVLASTTIHPDSPQSSRGSEWTGLLSMSIKRVVELSSVLIDTHHIFFLIIVDRFCAHTTYTTLRKTVRLTPIGSLKQFQLILTIS